MKEREKEINFMIWKVTNLEKKNLKLETKGKTVLIEKTETAITCMSKQQDEIDKHSGARLDSLTSQQ
jgi:hypothetical protein